MKQPSGKLYLVPAPLDFGCSNSTNLHASLPLASLQTAARLRYWVCENAKSARAYLQRIDAITPLDCRIQDLQLLQLPHEVRKKGDHHGNFDARELLQPALQGHDLGLLSEAGMPAVADPGASVVRAAHELGIQVLALVGPSSILLALAASGLNGQNFAFVGYLPQEPLLRSKRIQELETLALRSGQTQLFIEVPYRNLAMLETLLQTLQHQTRLAISSAIGLPQAQVSSDSVKGWRKKPVLLDNATPAVFAIGR